MNAFTCRHGSSGAAGLMRFEYDQYDAQLQQSQVSLNPRLHRLRMRSNLLWQFPGHREHQMAGRHYSNHSLDLHRLKT